MYAFGLVGSPQVNIPQQGQGGGAARTYTAAEKARMSQQYRPDLINRWRTPTEYVPGQSGSSSLPSGNANTDPFKVQGQAVGGDAEQDAEQDSAPGITFGRESDVIDPCLANPGLPECIAKGAVGDTMDPCAADPTLDGCPGAEAFDDRDYEFKTDEPVPVSSDSNNLASIVAVVGVMAVLYFAFTR